MTQEENELEQAAGLTTTVTLDRVADGSTRSMLMKYLMACAHVPGFLNAEITPPHKNSSAWIVVHRFVNEAQANAWLASKERRDALEQLPEGKVVSEQITPHVSGGTVAASVTSAVSPGAEPLYREWVQKIHAVQSEHPGYEGSYVQPPASTEPHTWVTLLRFATPESLNSWLNSEQRSNLMNEAKSFIQYENIKRMTSSFPAWVPLDPDTEEPAANWKMWMLIVLGALPIGLIEMRFLLPILPKIQPALQALLLNLFNVSIVTWVTMPIFNKVFYWWMVPDKARRAQVDLTGALIVIGLYAIITIALWNLNPIRP